MLDSRTDQGRSRALWNFAPFPISALTDGRLDKKSQYFLLFLLALRTRHQLQDAFTITDAQILRGDVEKQLPPCGLSRNSMKDARNCLIQAGYIEVQELGKGPDDQSLRRYFLKQGKAVRYKNSACQELTETVSEIDKPYKEEKEYRTHSEKLESRDRKERRCREFSRDSNQTLERLMALISELYPHYNRRRLPVPNPVKAKAALRRFLLDNPEYPEEALLEAIHNKFASEGHLQAPERWIPYLSEYIDSPLDKYNHPIHRYVPEANWSMSRAVQQ